MQAAPANKVGYGRARTLDSAAKEDYYYFRAAMM